MKTKVLYLVLILLILVGCGDSKDIAKENENTATTEDTVSTAEEVTDQPEKNAEVNEVEEVGENTFKNLSGKVVVMGDSLWGLDKGPEGIAGYLEAITMLEIKNHCFPGTCASRIEKYSGTKDSMVAILVDNQDERSEEIKKDIREAQYVFIEHCSNDYSMGVPPTGEDNSYEQALLESIATIKSINPDIKIVMLLPTLGYLINFESLTNEYDFGGGTIDSYIDIMKSVAEKEGASVIDMQNAWTLTKENWNDYLVDGAHLKKEARREYAYYLAQELNGIFAN